MFPARFSLVEILVLACTRFSIAEILVLAGTAGASGMVPPTSARMSARMNRVQGHIPPANVWVVPWSPGTLVISVCLVARVACTQA